MFKRKTITDIDLFNKLNTIENKLDVFAIHKTQNVTQENQEKEDISQSVSNKYMHLENKFDIACSTMETNLKIFIKQQDQKLRSDLHSFILGIKQEICKETLEHINTLTNNLKEENKNLGSNEKTDITLKDNNILKDIKETLTLVSSNVDGFFFDNETIKHQLQIEEDIRKYMDDIDALKISIEKINNSINTLIIELKFETD